jgi:SAM-dependent methyltransferase
MSRLLHWLRLTWFSYQKLGLVRLIRSRCIAHLRRKTARYDDFDHTYGTDTAESLTPTEAAITGEAARHAWTYTPIESADFHRMIADLGLAREALTAYTFIDIGSGKGRAVLLAATYPFQRVMGVEMSALLHQAALQNAAHFQAHRHDAPSIDFCCQDATVFPFPDDPLVLYFFHPFDESIMARVTAQMRQAVLRLPRPIFLLYNRGVNLQPYPADLLSLGGLLHCLRERPSDPWQGQTGWFVYSNTPHPATGASSAAT